MKRQNKVKIEWTPNFAYAIGIIATDGNLSPDGRHINLTSKDKELIVSFKKCLGIKNKIGRKGSGTTIGKKYFADFLRGCIDGDGNISTSTHPESRHLQLKIRLSSASIDFLDWIKEEISLQLKINCGWISKSKSVYTLNYAKRDSIKLLKFMYYNRKGHYLRRKYLIGKRFLNK